MTGLYKFPLNRFKKDVIRRKQNLGFLNNLHCLERTSSLGSTVLAITKDVIFFLLGGSHKGFKVRRLSTVSSVVAPVGHIFSTRWNWYWQDENQTWQSYDTPDDGHAVNTTSSQCLEKEYVEGIRLFFFFKKTCLAIEKSFNDKCIQIMIFYASFA